MPKANRSRSSSQVLPNKEFKRQYSYLISSVASDVDESVVNKNKKIMNDVDLENQLILTAGGRREDVFYFFAKLVVLMGIVFGSGVLIFYAL